MQNIDEHLFDADIANTGAPVGFKTLWGHHTPPNSEIICGQNVGTKVVCGMILFFEKKAMLKI